MDQGLKAGLAIIQTAATPPEPKRQVNLEIQKMDSGSLQHLDNPEPPKPQPENPHKNAQPDPPVPSRPLPAASLKVGRNEPCPCGSALK